MDEDVFGTVEAQRYSRMVRWASKLLYCVAPCFFCPKWHSPASNVGRCGRSRVPNGTSSAYARIRVRSDPCAPRLATLQGRGDPCLHQAGPDFATRRHVLHRNRNRDKLCLPESSPNVDQRRDDIVNGSAVSETMRSVWTLLQPPLLQSPHVQSHLRSLQSKELFILKETVRFTKYETYSLTLRRQRNLLVHTIHNGRRV